MAVTVENGTIVAGANSFVTRETVAAYALERGLSFTGTNALLDTAVIRSGDYLRNEERFKWRGTRVQDEQPMPFPRANCVPMFGTGTALANNVIPKAVKDAQCELAVKALAAINAATDLQPDLARGGAIRSVSAGSVSVTFAEDALAETLIQVAKGILRPYIRSYTGVPTEGFMQPDLRTYDDVSDPSAGTDITDDTADDPTPSGGWT